MFALSTEMIDLCRESSVASCVCMGLLCWLAAELAFFVFVRLYLLPALQPLRRPPPHLMRPEALLMKVMDTVDMIPGYSFEEFVTGWFLGTPFASVRADNARSFLAWVMFSEHMPDLTERQREHLERVFQMLETRYGKFAEGFNPDAQHNRMTLDNIATIHRPLFGYVLTTAVDLVTVWLLCLRGFRSFSFRDITYHYRPAQTLHPVPQLPVVLFHGICSGWVSYLGLILKFSRDVDREILCIDYPYIAMKMRFDVAPPDVFMSGVRAILQRHGLGKVAVCGHSFGTILAGWMLRYNPQFVAQVTLLDPVCLLMALPDVAVNFLHRPPITWTQTAMRYLAAREISVAHVLHRHFWWYMNLTWIEDVTCPCMVFVGSKDEVTNPTLVAEYVTAHASKTRKGDVSLIFEDGFHHGQLLISQRALESVLEAFHAQEKTLLHEHEELFPPAH